MEIGIIINNIESYNFDGVIQKRVIIITLSDQQIKEIGLKEKVEYISECFINAKKP